MGKFAATNRIIGPNSVAIDRAVVGYLDNDGFSWKPDYGIEEMNADQEYVPLGGQITEVKGSFGFKALELLDADLVTYFDLAAGAAITSPLAGTRYSLMPNKTQTVRQVERWGLGVGGLVHHQVIAGTIEKPPALDYSRTKATIANVEFALKRLNVNYPIGFWDSYTAISGAPTVTCVPLDAATGVAATATPTLTFTKPMFCSAVAAGHFALTKDADSSAVAFTVAFGTVAVGAVTMIDPTKIVITPGASLTAGAAYTLFVYTGIPAVDGTTIAANLEINFTVAA